LVATLVQGYLVKTNLSAPHNVTTDTAANIQGTFGATAGAYFDWVFANNSGQVATIVAGGGCTLIGNGAIPNTDNMLVRFINTGAGAVDIVIMGN
jgi:hypothetical protein